MNEKQKIQRELIEQGYVVRIDKWPQKATYYRPDGHAMHNLPADPYSMQKYTRRGFTLTPPEKPVETLAGIAEGNGLVCSDCGFTAKSEFGLRSHTRKHNKEETHVNT